VDAENNKTERQELYKMYFFHRKIQNIITHRYSTSKCNTIKSFINGGIV
jgi:hypothetical protein